jgi:hypothetical protein
MAQLGGDNSECNVRTCEFSRSMVGSAGTRQPASPPRAASHTRLPPRVGFAYDAAHLPAAPPQPRQQPLGRARAGGGAQFGACIRDT